MSRWLWGCGLWTTSKQNVDIYLYIYRSLSPKTPNTRKSSFTHHTNQDLDLYRSNTRINLSICLPVKSSLDWICLGCKGGVTHFFMSNFETGIAGLNGPPHFGRPRRFHAKRGWPKPKAQTAPLRIQYGGGGCSGLRPRALIQSAQCPH